jgi:hypothetical protein
MNKEQMCSAILSGHFKGDGWLINTLYLSQGNYHAPSFLLKREIAGVINLQVNKHRLSRELSTVDKEDK